jgi:solute carrier family 13 (sodium-dependent dicarboxylate transporter), member 2/3/5
MSSRKDPSSGSRPDFPGPRALWVIGAGMALFLALLILPPPEGMPVKAWRVVAVGLLMAFWWVTEVLPVAATALLPVVLFPLLGVSGLRDTTAPYADPIIFLFLGGLLLGLALQKWDLHRRIALRIVSWVGLRPANLVLGFMAATAFLSMWVSNTATAAMMLPVSMSVVVLLVGAPGGLQSASPERRDFALSLLLGVAFAASIGGIGTLIGTPPNALFAGFMRRAYGIEIGFAQWMMLGVPIAVVFLLGAWLLLTRVVFRVPAEEPPGVGERLEAEMSSLPPLSGPERRVGILFLITAAAWIARPLMAGTIPGLDDTVIAIAAAFLLFVIPSGRGGFLMDWGTAARLPWDVLLLFGGGLSLAAAISDSGLSVWIGDALAQLETLPLIVLVMAIILVTTLLSELASNTATAAAILPVAGAIAAQLGLDAAALTVPVVLAASCGFMLPVATPPNALFYSSGYIKVAQMARAGVLVDILGVALVLAASYGLARIVF